MTALALKYRPQRLEDYVGNSEAVASIQSIVESGDIPNAIMLHGQSGTGKTTLARIFAMMLNETDTVEEGDVEELNAAEARGIDDVRALIDRSRYAPTNKFKVIIVDEVHQLTTQAVEAFLKPLEEPPPNTVYVLCTTDPQKFPQKILNRCFQIHIQSAGKTELAKHLFKVSKLEKHPISKELALKLAEAAGGSVRAGMYKLESALNLLKAGKDPEAALDATLQDEAKAEEIAGSLLYALYNLDLGEAICTLMQLPREASGAQQVIDKALWGAEFCVAAYIGKKFATQNSFPSDFNKKALATVKEAKADPFEVLEVQGLLYRIRNAIMFATSKPASAALAELSLAKFMNPNHK